MMADGETLAYTLEVQDEASDKLDKIGNKAQETSKKLDDNVKSQESAVLQSIKAMTAMSAVVGGLNAVTGAMDALQIGSEETRKSIRMLASGINLFVGTAQAIMGAVTVIQTLNTALKGTAIMSAFAYAAANPLVGLLAVGAAGAAGGYMIGMMNSSTSTTTVKNINLNSVPSTPYERQSSALMTAGGW
jgi:hypothetical protein